LEVQIKILKMKNTQTLNNFLQRLDFKKIINDSPSHYYTHQATFKQVKIDSRLEIITFIEKNGKIHSAHYLFDPSMETTEKLIKTFLNE